MSQFAQLICIGIGVLVLATSVLRQVSVVRQRRAQKDDPLRYLRGKSREEIGKILRTPVYDPPPKTRARQKNKMKQRD